MKITVKVLCLAAILLGVRDFSFTMDSLRVGNAAPGFTLSYATKDTVISKGFSLAKRIGTKKIILAFYPADWSGGCTSEMCTFRDSFSELANLDAEVYGISGDYVWSHRKWAEHLDLQFPLLSDHDHAVAKAYYSYNSDTGMNKRTVYVIDEQGKIVYIDMEYSARSLESFTKLKSALSELK